MLSCTRWAVVALFVLGLLLGAGVVGASSITLTNIDQTTTQYRESDDYDSGTFEDMNATGTGVRDDCSADTCRLTVDATTGTLVDSVVGSGTAFVDIGIAGEAFADSSNTAFTGGQFVEGAIFLDFDISIVTDSPSDTWTLAATNLVFSGSLIAVCETGCDDLDDGSEAAAWAAGIDVDGAFFSFSQAVLTAGDGNYPGTENFLDSASSASVATGTGSQVIPASATFMLASYSAQDDSFFGVDGDALTANGEMEAFFAITFVSAPEPSTGLLAGLSLIAACLVGRGQRTRARRS